MDLIKYLKDNNLLDKVGLTNESLNEQKLDEKIPAVLAKAYQNAQEATNGIQIHPSSRHGEIDQSSNPDARFHGLKYDYERATYQRLTPQQAFAYLGWNVNYTPETGAISCGSLRGDVRTSFNERLCNLRFIINDRVIEYEVRAGNRLYLAYWCNIPDRYFEAKHFDLFPAKNDDETNDVRFAVTYGDLAKVFFMADYIYKTDEYSQTPRDRDKARSPIVQLDRYTDTPNHRLAHQHAYLDTNWEQSGGDTYLPKGLDTGAHISSISNPDILFRNDIDNVPNDNASDQMRTYFEDLEEKQIAKKNYIKAMNYHKTLIKNKDSYDKKEYVDLLAEAEKDEAEYKAKYDEINLKTFKDSKFIVKSAGEDLLKENKKLRTYVNLIQDFLNEIEKRDAEILKIKKAYEKAQLTKATDIPEIKDQVTTIQRAIDTFNDNIKSARNEINAYEQEIQRMLAQIEAAQHRIDEMNLNKANYEKQIEDCNKDLNRWNTKMSETVESGLNNYINSWETEYVDKLKEFGAYVEKQKSTKVNNDPRLKQLFKFIDDAVENADKDQVEA